MHHSKMIVVLLIPVYHIPSMNACDVVFVALTTAHLQHTGHEFFWQLLRYTDEQITAAHALIVLFAVTMTTHKRN